MSFSSQFSPFLRTGSKVTFKTGLNGEQYPSLTADPVGLIASDAGLMWYRSDLSVFKYWTGTTAVVFESSAGGDSLQTSYDGGNTISLAAATPVIITQTT